MKCETSNVKRETSNAGRTLRRATNRAIWGVVVAFLVLGAIYSVVTPLFEAPDEAYHYPFVRHLASGHGLPVQDLANLGPWRQEGGQPPLYYALAALVSRWVPSDDLPEILQRNPHADIGLVRPDGNANMVIHGPREAFPYRGAALAVHIVRWFSVLLGALSVYFTYLVGLEVLPHRPQLALAAAAVVAFTPMFLFISGAVNNDNLVVTLSTASLWLLLRLLRLPPTPGRFALLGAVIGLAALSKVSALGLLPLTALALAWLSCRRRDWKLFLWSGACIVGVAALVAGWWYYRNWRLYGDPLGLNVFLAIVGSRNLQPSLRQLLAERQGLVMSYWGVFGWMNVVAPAWLYRLLNGLALLGAAGLAAQVAGRVRRRQWPDPAAAFRLVLVASWPLIVAASLVRWTMMTMASQGRLLFPAIASLSYLMVLGWGCNTYCVIRNGPRPLSVRHYASRITHYVVRSTPLAPIALMATVAIWVPFGVIAPAYTRPPLLTPAEQEAIPERLNLVFGDRMELLGFELGAEQVRPGEDLAVTLYWRARAPMSHNYSVFVQLLAENDLIVGQRDTYPGRGAFPTTFWQPGDTIADTYVIPVSPTAFSPGRAQVVAGLYRLETGERLPVRDRESRELGDHVGLGQILVRSEPRDGMANPLDFDLGNKVALIGYDMSRTALHAGETLHLTLYWKALAPMGRNYTVFAQVVGPNHSIWAQRDAWPLDGAAPTSSWQVGQVLEDRYDLVVRPETPEGVYEIHVGMYLGETLERLPVLAPDGRAVDDRILLNPIRVLLP